MQIFKYGKDYKLISNPLNPHLYEVKVIGRDSGLTNTNLLVTNSEFKNSSIELVGEKNSICSFFNSILENRVEILLITDTKIESSSIKDTILSQVELIKNSSMSNFKSIKRSYKDFNAVISEEAKYIGVVDRLLELL